MKISHAGPESEYSIVGAYCVKNGYDDYDWYLGHRGDGCIIWYIISFDENGMAQRVRTEGFA